MDPLAGSVASMMVVTMYFATLSLAAVPGVWKMALAIHVGGWVPQFIGHGIFERRAPALLDSLDQALLTAPLFIILEVFFFFGYRREFYKKMMKQVEVNIKEFKEGKKNKKWGAIDEQHAVECIFLYGMFKLYRQHPWLNQGQQELRLDFTCVKWQLFWCLGHHWPPHDLTFWSIAVDQSVDLEVKNTNDINMDNMNLTAFNDFYWPPTWPWGHSWTMCVLSLARNAAAISHIPSITLLFVTVPVLHSVSLQKQASNVYPSLSSSWQPLVTVVPSLASIPLAQNLLMLYACGVLVLVKNVYCKEFLLVIMMLMSSLPSTRVGLFKFKMYLELVQAMVFAYSFCRSNYD